MGTDERWRQDRMSDEFGASIELLENWISKEISRRRAAGRDADAERDILGRFMASHAETELSDWELNQLCMTFLSMGHENVATAIAWTLVFLGERQELQQRVRDEIRSVLQEGRSSPKVPSYKLLEQMPLLTEVFEEAVRLFPSVPAVTRCAQCPTELFGFAIPRGTEVVLNLYAAQRQVDAGETPVWMP